MVTHTHTDTHTDTHRDTHRERERERERGNCSDKSDYIGKFAKRTLERQTYTWKEAVQRALCVVSLFVQTPQCHHHCQQLSLLSFEKSHDQGGKQTTHETDSQTVICFTLNHNILALIRKYFIATLIGK